jgi:hypothetical protein
VLISRQPDVAPKKKKRKTGKAIKHSRESSGRTEEDNTEVPPQIGCVVMVKM